MSLPPPCPFLLSGHGSITVRARESFEHVAECADVAVRGGVLDLDGDEPGRRGEARDASSKSGTS
ncbi:hypothetical protein ACRCUN_05630 [Mycobacterium sp. LTG2003]